jgi:hypothetical protein
MSKIENPVVLIHKCDNNDSYAVAITNGSQNYHDALLMATMEPDMVGDDVDTWSKPATTLRRRSKVYVQNWGRLKQSIVRRKAGCAERCTSGLGRRDREIVRLRLVYYSIQLQAGLRVCSVYNR